MEDEMFKLACHWASTRPWFISGRGGGQGEWTKTRGALLAAEHCHSVTF